MHCLHWKSLEARFSFHVSHYLLGLILFDTMEEDGRCFPESECFSCMRSSYLSMMAWRWCCSISMWLDGGRCISSPLMSQAFRDLERCRQHQECVQEDHVWACMYETRSAKAKAFVRSRQCLFGINNIGIINILRRWLRSLEQTSYFENHERHPCWWLGPLGDSKTSSSDTEETACGDILNQTRMWCGSAFPWQMCLGLSGGNLGSGATL